jgi:hypothetical protein
MTSVANVKDRERTGAIRLELDISHLGSHGVTVAIINPTFS